MFQSAKPKPRRPIGIHRAWRESATLGDSAGRLADYHLPGLLSFLPCSYHRYFSYFLSFLSRSLGSGDW